MGRSAMLWGFVLLVLVVNSARAEDKPDPVADYKTFLASLPKDDPASITKAIDQYRAAIVPLDMDKHVKAFLEFLDHYDGVCGALCRAFWDRVDGLKSRGIDEWKAIEAVQNSEEAQKLTQYGLEFMNAAEDGFYIRGIPEYIPTVFSPDLPLSVRTYLKLRKVDMKERYWVDGSITVSFTRLAERTAQWDQYIHDFPNSAFRLDAFFFRTACLRQLLLGDSYREPQDVKAVYEKFLRDYPNTYPGHLVRRQYEVFRKAGYFSGIKDDFTIPCSTHDEVMNWLKESGSPCECWFPDDVSYRASSCERQ